MKTTPDETTLTLWMDGELEGSARENVEAWALENPEILAERDAVQAMSARIREHVPGSVEPPHSDFFNQRILRHIKDEIPASHVTPVRKKSNFWQWLAVPVAAGAMAVCFYMGTRVGEGGDISAPNYTVSTSSSVYAPDGDVKASMFTSENATVIVLEGLDDIPDDFEMAGEPTSAASGTVMVNTGMTF